MDLNQKVCGCKGVTIGDIKIAIENGATKFEDVQETTKVGTGCGRCVDSVKEIVLELLK